MVDIVGGVLAEALTVSVKVVLVEAVPSLTATVIVAVPACPAAGVTVTVRFAAVPPKVMFAFGTRVVLLDVPLRVRLEAAVSASPIVNARGPTATQVVVVWFAMVEIVGGVFDAGELIVSVSVALPVPAEFVAASVTAETPAVVGTPLITPVLVLIARPAGKFVAP